MSRERCAIYARVSTVEQVKQYGLAAQVSDLKAAAKARGYSLHRDHEFREEGISGSDWDRPGFDRLREVAAAHGVDVVLIYDPDRLARKLAYQVMFADEFERAGVRLEFVTTPVEDTPEGRMFFHMKGVFSEYEKGKILDRTRRGRLMKAKAGFIVVGPRVPYGYRYLGKAQNEKGRYVIEEAEAVVVRQMFRWLVEDGCSIREIAVRLNAQGYRSQRSGQWAKSSVRRILGSPLYAGTAYYNRSRRGEKAAGGRPNKPSRERPVSDWIPIAVPPIVDVSIHVRALEQFRLNAQRLAGRNTRNLYLLRGLLYCGECGRRMAGCPSHETRFYRCFGKDRLSGPNRCTASLLHSDRIERFTWDVVSQILRRPELLLEKLRAYDQVNEEHRDTFLVDRTRLERTLHDLESRQSRLLDERLAGNFDSDVIERKAKELAAQRAAAAAEMDRVNRRIHSAKAPRAREVRLREFCGLAIRGLDSLDPAGRQQLLRELLDEVRIHGTQVHIRGVLPGEGREESLRSRTGQAESRTQHKHVVIGLQPPDYQFSLDTCLDSPPSIEAIQFERF